MKPAPDSRRTILAGLVLAAPLGAFAPGAPPVRAQATGGAVVDGLLGKQCRVMDYVGSYRSPLGSPIDRRPISTIVERGSLHYVEASRIQLVLEGGTERSADELTQLDRRLEDRPDLQGFYPGEVAVVTSVKKKEDRVELELSEPDAGNGPQRRGRIVFRFESGVPAEDSVLEEVLRLLLPKPPYRDADEKLRVILAVIHRMELSALAEWIGDTREETIHRVAEASLELGGLAEEERSAILECYEQSYLSLSDRSRIALVDLAVGGGTEARVLEAVARPHLPLLGDWETEAQRAKGAFAWSTTKVLKNLGRKCTVPGVETLLVTIQYDYQDRRGWGSDRLSSRVPLEVARAYAAIEIGTREMAGRSEHSLNDLPLSLGDW